MTTLYYCVVSVGKNSMKKYPKHGENGQSVFKAACALKPGTVFGSGKTPALAEEDARLRAMQAQRMVA